MDEVWFHLSNRLEALQVELPVVAHRGQQWIITWFHEGQRYLAEISNQQYIQNIKNIGQRILTWLYTGWEQICFQYNSIKPRDFYRHVWNFCCEATRREIIFCLTGLSIGVIIGYSVGICWRYSSHHLHHMKAVVCHHYIGVEGVSMIDDAEMPTLHRSTDVLIQVKAASVNIVDTKICSGYSKTYRRLLNTGKDKELPVVLGRECAGVIVDIGQNVINFDIGDEVFLAVPSWAPGTMAEYLICSENRVVKKPRQITFETSASFPYGGCIAWDALVNRSNIEEGNARGKRVLIYGGTTPIGCVLIQLVKLWGGYVITICRQHTVSIVRALGADEVISLSEVDIEKELKLHVQFDAIFYTGDQTISEEVLKKYLVPSGSFVSTVPENLTSDSLGFIFGSIFAGCVRIKLLVQYVLGFNAYQWQEGSKLNPAYLRALSDLIEANQLQPVVDKVYAPHHIEHALQHVLDKNAFGSTIVKFH